MDNQIEVIHVQEEEEVLKILDRLSIEEEESEKRITPEFVNDLKSICSEILNKSNLSHSPFFSDTALSMSLTCALTNEKLVFPVRTSECKHMWCIEKQYYQCWKKCTCGEAINENNIIVDQKISCLIKMYDFLQQITMKEYQQIKISNNQEISNDDEFDRYEPIVLFDRSKLFFLSLNDSILPLPRQLYVEHIQSPSNIHLNYSFKFKPSDFLFKNNLLLRACFDQPCFYEINELYLASSSMKCKYCQNQIDIFSFQIDEYFMKVLKVLQIKLTKEKDQEAILAMQFQKFKIRKILYTPVMVDEILQEQSLQNINTQESTC